MLTWVHMHPSDACGCEFLSGVPGEMPPCPAYKTRWLPTPCLLRGMHVGRLEAHTYEDELLPLAKQLEEKVEFSSLTLLGWADD